MFGDLLGLFEDSGLVIYVCWTPDMDGAGHAGMNCVRLKSEDNVSLSQGDTSGSGGQCALPKHGARLMNRIPQVYRPNPTPHPPRMVKDAPAGWSRYQRKSGTAITRIWVSQRARRIGLI